MFTRKPKTNNKLLAAYNSIAQMLPTIRVNENPNKPDAYKVSRKKTKKGATHIVGTHFKPRFLFHDKNGKPITPAMYGRLHMGAQRKKKRNNGPKTSI